MKRLDLESCAAAATELAARDADLARVLERYGPPPLWSREPGFATLVHIILEQQVSLASARATFDRLAQAVSPLAPAGLLQLSDAELLAIGFSGQKTRYCRALASAIVDGELDLADLARLEDDEVAERLLALPGIGPWTVSIYLLMALLRPDVWPRGDLALVKAAREIKRLDELPSAEELEELAEGWRPYRSVAARLLWFHYLGGES